MPTTMIASISQIAEDFGKEIGLGKFEIDRIVRSREDGKDEWIVHLQLASLDPAIEDDQEGAIIVVDAKTEKPRLIEGL